MPQTNNNLSTDLRGLSSLTVDAVLGMTDIVESMHHTVLRAAGAPVTSDSHRTSGITGLVYNSIRTITKGVGKGIDVPLAQMSTLLGEKDAFPGREAMLAAMNGVLGDHLVAKNNPLAIPMQFRRSGQPLTEQMLTEAVQQSAGKLVILVHGLCMNDLQWQRQGHDHGAALARDLGFELLYLHYNSGLHISENGQEFSDLLESLVEQVPQPLELVIIGHSMGGLVARSACYYGETAGYTWPAQLQKLIFLGTPHHGAVLEKGGNLIDVVLGTSPYSAPFSRLGKIRSSGTTDLRYGNVVDEDWHHSDRFDLTGDQRVPVPLPEDVACYAIAATTSQDINVLGEDLIGDGLVTVSSALGHHKNADLTLMIPETQQWVGQDMNHLDLLNHPDVYETLKMWLET
jgi:pimeloyl-ACP methyl ester carboxylesterase